MPARRKQRDPRLDAIGTRVAAVLIAELDVAGFPVDWQVYGPLLEADGPSSESCIGWRLRARQPPSRPATRPAPPGPRKPARHPGRLGKSSGRSLAPKCMRRETWGLSAQSTCPGLSTKASLLSWLVSSSVGES